MRLLVLRVVMGVRAFGMSSPAAEGVCALISARGFGIFTSPRRYRPGDLPTGLGDPTVERGILELASAAGLAHARFMPNRAV